LEQQRAVVQDARSRFDEVKEHEDEARKTLDAARKAFADTDNRLRGLQPEVGKLEQAFNTLLMHASPDENSLLYLLRSERPDWTQDIAKVLREDLLARTDLSPTIGTIHDSVYGLQLDLDALETPLVANESELQREIEANRDAMRDLQSHIGQQEAALAQRGAERAAADAALGQRSREVATSRVGVTSAEQQERTAYVDVQRSRNAAKDLAQAAYNDADRVLKAAQQQVTQHRARLKQDLTLLSTRQAERRDESKRALDLLLVEIDGKEAAATKRFNDACADIERERTARLKEQGVDTEALKALEQKIGAADKDLMKIQQSRDLIAQWRNWLSSHWSRKPGLEDELVRVRHEKSGHEDASAAITKAWHEDQTNRRRVINDLEQRLGELRTQRSRVADHRRGLESYPIDTNQQPDDTEAWTLIVLVGQANEQKRSVGMQENRLHQEIDALKRKFSANRGTPPDQYYEMQRGTIGPDRAERPREWVPHFKAWYSTEHEHYRNLLRIDARTIADSVGDFRDRMDTFHRKVLQFNRELQENLNSNLGFESIASLSIEIASSIRELEYWSTIDKVAESRREWLAGDLPDLPPPEFASSLRELLQHWQLKEGIQAELTHLVRIQGEVVENGNRRPFRKAEDLETISSNGLSYIVMVLIFVGFINRVRGKAPVDVVWALDEIKDLDIGNVELLMEILGRNNITLVSACPDPDPDVLALFRNRRSIRADRCIYDPSDAARVGRASISEEAKVEPAQHFVWWGQNSHEMRQTRCNCQPLRIVVRRGPYRASICFDEPHGCSYRGF